MKQFEGLLTALAQYSHRVDDGINSFQFRYPVHGLRVEREIGFNGGFALGKGVIMSTNSANDDVTVPHEFRKQMSPNESGGARQQYTHSWSTAS
jgi:hypothetical protein